MRVCVCVCKYNYIYTVAVQNSFLAIRLSLNALKVKYFMLQKNLSSKENKFL